MQIASQFEILVLLLVVTLAVALVSRGLRIPYTLALVVTGLALGFSQLFPQVRLDPVVVLFVFLPVLLFEGAWSINLAYLIAEWVPIALLAVPGLMISILVTATVLHAGVGLAWLVALLLGAVISPTDPVAVLALFRQLGLPTRLRTLIEGESLFNDGIATAIFTTVLALIVGEAAHVPRSTLLWQTGLHSLWLLDGGPRVGSLVFLVAAYF